MKLSAFTLIELLVSMTIIGIMSAISISAYPKFSEQVSLSSQTYKMLAYIRETQSYGVAAISSPGTKFIYAFQVDKSSNTLSRIKLESPTDTTNTYLINTSISDVTSATSSLKEMYEIYQINGYTNTGTTSLDKAYGFFKRPNPEGRLVGMTGTNISPDTGTGSFNKLEIILRSKRNTQFMKKVVILSTGQAYVGDW